VEQLGAWSGAEGVETLLEPALEFIGTHSTRRRSRTVARCNDSIHENASIHETEVEVPLRVTYDPGADAAYIYLTGRWVSRGRVTVPVPLDDQDLPEVILDFKDGRLVGVEVLGAKDGLPPDLLGLA
jgi:uncharacterized protein YuzE